MKDRVIRSWQEFDQAVSLMPNLPDPHLGLARLYVYSFRDLDKAIEEWNKAEQHGYKLAGREIEQEADGFRLRAQKEMADPHDHSIAQEDLARAKELYTAIPYYDGVAHRLKLVAQDELTLNPPPAIVPAPAPPAAKREASAKTAAAKTARQPKRTPTWQSPKAGKRRKS
jgi:hypothetical protein